MNKILITILFVVVMMGNPMTNGWFTSPTGETVYWKWVNHVLYVADSDRQCLYNNNGIPRKCTKSEQRVIFKYFNIKL